MSAYPNKSVFMPLKICARYMLSPKIRAKKVRIIKDKLCIFIIQETFVLSSICLKCQHTQIKAFLCFKLKRDEKGRGTAITKQLLFGYPDIFAQNPGGLEL